MSSGYESPKAFIRILKNSWAPEVVPSRNRTVKKRRDLKDRGIEGILIAPRVWRLSIIGDERKLCGRGFKEQAGFGYVDGRNE